MRFSVAFAVFNKYKGLTETIACLTITFLIIDKEMEESTTLRERRKGKKDIIYCRMDNEMINELFTLRETHGISVSEIVRESVRRLIDDAKMVGGVSLSI